MRVNLTHGEYYCGLDLGGVQQFTALAVLERTTSVVRCPLGENVSQFAVRHLERFPLGTPYPKVCLRLQRLFAAPPLRNAVLAVDQTGVSKPVVDLVRDALEEVSFSRTLITAGQRAVLDYGTWRVPKVELIGTLQVLMQARRLKFAPDLPHARTLVAELTNFTWKPSGTQGDDVLAWRDGGHDDLVLAAALAAWHGQRCQAFGV